uniref:Cingulin n=1 Tax=Calidris pygmaea TaxID=425635 RepID=A0A8C3JQ65_9CHAR
IKQSPVDYGVQIRFINDLQEPRRPPKARGGKPGSYGVAVRVQGIAGQPFVVLNSGEKGGESFGVQIKSDGSYPNPPAGPRPPGSVGSDSDLPENPYVGRPPRHGSSHSTSDEETGGVGVTPRRRSSVWHIGPERSGAAGSGDVDTKPLSSVDSLISKFDGKVVQQRGRAARRGRIPSEERKRSQSLDGRLPGRREAPDARELSGARDGGLRPSVPTGSLSRPSRAGGTEDGGTRGQRATRGQLKSTPDLLRDQREVTQPGSSEHPKELIYSILKEGSNESEISLKRKTARLLEKMQELAVSQGPPCLGGDPKDLARKVEELQEKLDEETKVKPGRRLGGLGGLWGGCGTVFDIPGGGRGEVQWIPALSPFTGELLETREELEEALSSKQRQEEQLRLRERELTALKGALKEEVASHDKELDRVRQQYQSDMDQLRRSMEGMTQDQASLESERHKINTVVKNLQRELEESAEETGHWRDMFQKNKDELRATKQELLQVKLEREEFEEELRELQERFNAAREDADQARSSAVDPGELEALRKVGMTKEETPGGNPHKGLRVPDGMQAQIAPQDPSPPPVQQLDPGPPRAVGTLQAKASLESAREASEQVRKTVESSLREVQDQNDDLRRKVLGMETQLKEYERLGENWEGSQARLKEKVTKLEAERRQMEESLGEATEREQELLMAKRSLETRLEEAQRGLARLNQEHQELSTSFQEEQRQKEQLKRAKSELEEQKRLLDRTTEKLNKELEQMTEESHSSLAALRSQLEEFKEKSRKEITDSQKQAKDRGAEVEKMQFSVGRLQDEVSRLKQALQESQAERESAQLDKEVLLQRLHNLEQEMDTKKRSQDDRSRHVKALEVGSAAPHPPKKYPAAETNLGRNQKSSRRGILIDQLRAELLQERSSRQDLECDKVSLERQNKELKSRLASSEGLQKPSSNVSQLEARVEELQDRLQAEEREKNVLLSSNRKLERKVKELTIQIDDERQHVSDQKDQLSLRVKALKRQVDEAEEEIERLEGARKKAQRDLEEQHELNEQLQNRIKALEKEAWRKAARSAADSSLQDDQLSSDEEFDSAYGPSSIASLLNEPNLQTSSC